MINFIEEYENAASDDYCDRVVQKFNELKSTASVHRGEYTNNGGAHRKDFQIFFEIFAPELAEETNQILGQCLELYIDKYPSIGQLNFSSAHVKVQQTPPKGGFHQWHCEQIVHHNSVSRILTWTIYLNDVPDGEGETEILEFGYKVKPKKGTLCFFPAAWTHTHRGNPMYTQDKYIATGWYYLS